MTAAEEEVKTGKKGSHGFGATVARLSYWNTGASICGLIEDFANP